jgi:hypothetical protein
MIFLVAGEGPSDMGVCVNQQSRCCGADFQAGPFAVMVRQIVDKELSKVKAGWELDAEAIEFVHRSEFATVELPKAQPTSTLLPGKKAKKETDDIYYYQAARILGFLAKSRAADAQCQVAAVLFHDADTRCSTKPGMWSEKAKSMRVGFDRVGCELGVPMVANPTSEAWLLCGLKASPYQNCTALESEVSASDKSPHSGKKLVEDAMAAKQLTGKTFGELVSEGHVETHRIDMPSFNAFRDRLVEVVTMMVPAHPKNRQCGGPAAQNN